EREVIVSGFAICNIHHRDDALMPQCLQRPTILNKNIWVRRRSAVDPLSDESHISDKYRSGINLLKNRLDDRGLSRYTLSIAIHSDFAKRFRYVCVRCNALANLL